MKQLLNRFYASRAVALELSRVMWQNLDVPLDMCVRQRRILARWDELQTLGGRCT